VIVDPVLDVGCLSRLTAIARHEIRNPLVAEYVERIRALARRRGISVTDAAIVWLQELPQTDDDGRESVRAIACGPDQRTRLFPDDPNCFERALAALILLESIDPTWQYTLASIDDPLRHTGLLRRPGAAYDWEPVDLFPSSGAAGGFFAWLRGAASPKAKRTSARRARRRMRQASPKAGYVVQRIATEPPMYYRVLVDNGGRYVQLVRLRPDGTTEGEPFSDDVLRYERVRRMRRDAAGDDDSDDLEVAETIREQLGAVTLAMLGAHQLAGDDNSLQFAIKGSRRVNKIRIVLDDDDTYTVEFWKVRGADWRKVAEHSGVYVDQLHELIERETGLYTRMRGAAGDDVIAAINVWLRKLEAQNPSYSYGYDLGPVYARIWKRLGQQDSRSVVNFVELSTGRLYRADSWKKAGRMLGVTVFDAADGASAPRNFGWDDFKGYAQPVMQYVHPVGKAVLGYFGAGAVGDYAEKYEKQYGLLKDDKKPEQKPTPAQPAKPAPAASTPAAPARPAAQPARPAQTFLPVRRPISAPPPTQPPSAPPAPASPSASPIDPYSTQGGPNADDESETHAFFWPPRRAASAREAAQAPQRRFW
jgi:hypothetical protein